MIDSGPGILLIISVYLDDTVIDFSPEKDMEFCSPVQ